MSNKYDYGIYRGVDMEYDIYDKSSNIRSNNMYMIIRSMQMFIYDNLPDTIPRKELERILQTQGYITVIEHNNNIYALNGTPSGELDEYQRPKQIHIVNNSLSINKTYTVDKDCILIMNDDLGVGLIPLFTKYSTLLSESEITMLLVNITKRVNNILTANDDTTYESAKSYQKKLEEGNLSVIMESKLYDSIKSLPVTETHARLGDLIDFHQYLKASLYNEIGLKDNINMKKERLVENEIDGNNDIIYPLVDSMFLNRIEGIEKVNKMFNLDISVNLNSSWKQRRERDETEKIPETIPETVTEKIPETVTETTL